MLHALPDTEPVPLARFCHVRTEIVHDRRDLPLRAECLFTDGKEEALLIVNRSQLNVHLRTRSLRLVRGEVTLVEPWDDVLVIALDERAKERLRDLAADPEGGARLLHADLVQHLTPANKPSFARGTERDLIALVESTATLLETRVECLAGSALVAPMIARGVGLGIFGNLMRDQRLPTQIEAAVRIIDPRGHVRADDGLRLWIATRKGVSAHDRIAATEKLRRVLVDVAGLSVRRADRAIAALNRRREDSR